MDEVTEDDIQRALESIRRDILSAQSGLAVLVELADGRYGNAAKFQLGRDFAEVREGLNGLVGVDFYGEPCGSVLVLEDSLMQEEAELEMFHTEKNLERAS